MVKKAVLGALLVGLVGVLVVGAVLATSADNVAEAQGQGPGRGRGTSWGAGAAVEESGRDQSAEAQGYGRGGYGRDAAPAQRQYPNYAGAPEDWGTYEGEVIQAPAAGVDLIIRTEDGEEVVIGTGPGYLADQGLELQDGDAVQVQGYWEGDEFKAAQVTRMADGQAITLRDEAGRPAWSGGNRQVNERPAAVPQGAPEIQSTQGQGVGQGRGRGRQGSGQGGFGGGEYGVPLTSGDLSESEVEALLLALEDEYKAWSVYEQVITDFGAVRPFTNIQRAEENHIAALARILEAQGLEVPANEWTGEVPSFDSLAEACAGGVQAEIDNAALYDQLFGMVENQDLVRVFTSLQRASEEQHLPAFERCAP